MRISRIHVQQPLATGTELQLEPAQAHYVAKVLRLAAGSPLVLFNGDGREYSARLIEAGKRQVRVALESAAEPTTESPLHSHLGLGISRGDRMDYAIQKSTELGVSEITPLFTGHCEVRLQGERVDKRQAHWQQVAVSACEQSGRVRVPIVQRPRSLEEWLAELDCPLRLMLDLDGGKAELPAEAPGAVALLIGPEGGLADSERAAAGAAGFRGLSLGGRVLRTETAPVAALALLQYLWGDLKLG